MCVHVCVDAHVCVGARVCVHVCVCYDNGWETHHIHTHTCHTYTSYLSQFKVNTETERDVNERFQYYQELVKQSAIFFFFRNKYQK